MNELTLFSLFGLAANAAAAAGAGRAASYGVTVRNSPIATISLKRRGQLRGHGAQQPDRFSWFSRALKKISQPFSDERLVVRQRPRWPAASDQIQEQIDRQTPRPNFAPFPHFKRLIVEPANFWGCGFKNAGQLQVGDTLLPFIAAKNSAIIKVSTSSLGHQLDANCIASTWLWRQGKRRSHDPQSAGAFTKLVIVASFRRVFIARH